MKKATKTRILQILFYFTLVVYTLLLLRVSLFKYTNLPELLCSPDRFYTRGLNLIPFAYDGAYSYQFLRQTLLNFLMYCPLGFLLSMKTVGKKRRPLYLLIPFGVSLFMEILQYTLYLCVADITYIIMNTLGGIFGFVCYAFFAYLFRKKRDTLNLVLTICMSCVAVLGFTAYIIGTDWSAYTKIFA